MITGYVRWAAANEPDITTFDVSRYRFKTPVVMTYNQFEYCFIVMANEQITYENKEKYDATAHAVNSCREKYAMKKRRDIFNSD